MKMVAVLECILEPDDKVTIEAAEQTGMIRLGIANVSDSSDGPYVVVSYEDLYRALDIVKDDIKEEDK